MSILTIFTPPWAQLGTGIQEVINQIKATHLPITAEANEQFIASLPPTFGDYPNHTDVAPAALFTALFAIIAAAHFYIFIKNYTRGQNFWISFGMGSYGIMKMIGMATRIPPAFDSTKVDLTVVAGVFTQTPPMYLNVLNMILAHRIFTWRHPETGASKVFNLQMAQCYFFVIAIIVLSVVGQVVPIYHFLSPYNATTCKRLVQAGAILQTTYAGASFLMIGIAYACSPGTIDHRFFRIPKKILREQLPHTFQPTWIESTNFWYFPTKGSQHIIYKDDPEGLDKAIRVISSDQEPASGLIYSRNPKIQRGPKMSANVAMVLSTSFALALASCFRCAVVFNTGARGGGPGKSMPFINQNYIMYIFYGGLEILVNVVYLVGRIDLRFYIPDMARKRTDGAVEEGRAHSTSSHDGEKEHLGHLEREASGQ